MSEFKLEGEHLRCSWNENKDTRCGLLGTVREGASMPYFYAFHYDCRTRAQDSSRKGFEAWYEVVGENAPKYPASVWARYSFENLWEAINYGMKLAPTTGATNAPRTNEDGRGGL